MKLFMHATLLMTLISCWFPGHEILAQEQHPETSPESDERQEKSSSADWSSGWGLAAGGGMHFIRQHEPAEDNTFGGMLSKDILLAVPGEGLELSLRPAFTVFNPLMLVDLGLLLRHSSGFSLTGGLGIDISGETELLDKSTGSAYIYVLERDSFTKRVFTLLGAQYLFEPVFLELQYRIELEKGAFSYWTHPDVEYRIPGGYRRHFLVTLMVGVLIDF